MIGNGKINRNGFINWGFLDFGAIKWNIFTTSTHNHTRQDKPKGTHAHRLKGVNGKGLFLRKNHSQLTGLYRGLSCVPNAPTPCHQWAYQLLHPLHLQSRTPSCHQVQLHLLAFACNISDTIRRTPAGSFASNSHSTASVVAAVACSTHIGRIRSLEDE